jgi:hypothetical protein
MDLAMVMARLFPQCINLFIESQLWEIFRSELWTQHPFPSPSLPWRWSILEFMNPSWILLFLFFSVTPSCCHRIKIPEEEVWLPSSTRIGCFLAWKQLFNAFSCLQACHEFLTNSSKAIELSALIFGTNPRWGSLDAIPKIRNGLNLFSRHQLAIHLVGVTNFLYYYISLASLYSLD